MHDAFVHLARALQKTPALTPSFAYAATAVRNECYSALRRRRRRAETPDVRLEPVTPDATEEERLIVETALTRLPPEQREVVYLKVFEGLTFNEIATRCGLSINTAASRYRYAMNSLRQSLGAAGGRA